MAAKKPVKKPTPKPVAKPPVQAEQIVSTVTDEMLSVRRCVCGEPVAKGQTWVCIRHQRTN